MKALNSRTESKKVILKIGGTSLFSGERIRNLVKTVALEVNKGKQIIVVVSAMGKTTDALIEHFVEACEKKATLQELDDVTSMGERTSVRLFAAALNAHGVNARYFDPSDPEWPIITDDDFGNANPALEACIPMINRVVLPTLERGVVPVIPGFVGRTVNGEVTTLGRGGSDTTAFILARAVKANEVVIVTDVAGIMKADPKIVSNPERIRSIDVRELVNLCDSGVKFIRRKALKFLDGSFKVRIVGNHEGAFVSEGSIVTGCLPENPVYLGYPSPVCVITIVGKELSNKPGILSRIFGEINRCDSPVFVQSIDVDTVCIYLPEVRAGEMAETLHSNIIKNGEGLAMALRKNLAFLKIVGVESENVAKILRRIIESLEERGIDIIGTHTVASNTLIFVDWTQKDTALSAVREAYAAL